MRLMALLLIFQAFQKPFVNCVLDCKTDAPPAGCPPSNCPAILPLSISLTGDTNTKVMAVTDPIQSITMTTFSYDLTNI